MLYRIRWLNCSGNLCEQVREFHSDEQALRYFEEFVALDSEYIMKTTEWKLEKIVPREPEIVLLSSK